MRNHDLCCPPWNPLFSSLFCSFACHWSFAAQDWWFFTVSSDKYESMDSTLQAAIEVKRCFYVALALFQCFPIFVQLIYIIDISYEHRPGFNLPILVSTTLKSSTSRYCCITLHHFEQDQTSWEYQLHQSGPPWTSMIFCCDFFRPKKSNLIQALVMATKHKAKNRWMGRSLRVFRSIDQVGKCLS